MSLSNLISSDEIQKNLDTFWSSDSNESSQLPNELAYDKNVKTFTGDKRDVATFGGQTAVTFPTKDVDEYNRLRDKGMSNTDAFKETGVLTYADEQLTQEKQLLANPKDSRYNRLLFEIDDSVSTFNPNAVWYMDDDYDEKYQIDFGKIGKNYPTKDDYVIGSFKEDPKTGKRTQRNAISTLGEILKHDKLFEAYPHLKNLVIELTNTDSNVVGELNKEALNMDGSMGIADLNQNRLVINMKHHKGDDGDSLKNTLLHEVQHFIDWAEMTPEEKLTFMDTPEGFLRLKRSNVDLEASAREAADRMNLSATQRRLIVPFSRGNDMTTIDPQGERDRLIKKGTMDSSNYLGADNEARRDLRDFVTGKHKEYYKDKLGTSLEVLNTYKYSDDHKRGFGVGFLADIYNASDKIYKDISDERYGLSEKAIWRENFRELMPISDIQKQNILEADRIARGILGRRDSKGSGKIKGTPFDVELNTLEKNGYNLSQLILAIPNILGAESSFGIKKNNPKNPSITGPMQIDFKTFKDSIKQGTLGPKYEQAVGLKKGTAKDMTLEEFTKFMNDPKTGLKNSVITAIGIIMVKVKNDINKEKGENND